MTIFGINFAPLNTPLHRRLETLSIFITFLSLPLLSFFGIFLIAYILFFTKYWTIAILYLFWIWVIDKDTPERGGRRVKWFSRHGMIKYATNYFPSRLRLEEGFELDPKRNYLLCAFPHGVLSFGVNMSIISNGNHFHDMFPQHIVNGLTLDINFKFPIIRDLFLLFGSYSVSSKSINYLLGYPGGGRIAVIVVGGAEEGFYARPGAYYIVLKNRKGFIKLALKNGSPLIPVFSFGEIDLFHQVDNPEGSLLRQFQAWFKRKTTIAPIIIYGRGVLQYTFGFLPKRKPLNVVVGKPIEVKKIENPTQEDIDTLHQKFIEELRRLFDTHKHEYIENLDKSPLIIC